MDAAEGRLLPIKNATGLEDFPHRDDLNGGGVVLDLITPEPGAYASKAVPLWWFGPHADAYRGGPTLLDLAGVGGSLSTITNSAYGKSGCRDFGIDRKADRLFARWQENNVGQVSIHKLSTKEWIADIWAPNATNGIVLTNDGFIYLADVAGWLLLYDYDGNFWGAMRNPILGSWVGGWTYGWDGHFKRLLFLPSTACNADGSSTLRPVGYYPVPAPELLSAPIPRSVPRKNRPVYFFCHVCGDGGEPMASRPATLGGSAPAQALRSDLDGDVIGRIIPAATGALTVEVTSQ